MHRNLEEALDRAEIVIVPIPSSPTQPTEWKLLLTREIMRHDTALGAGSSRMSWDVSHAMQTSCLIINVVSGARWNGPEVFE